MQMPLSKNICTFIYHVIIDLKLDPIFIDIIVMWIKEIKYLLSKLIKVKKPFKKNYTRKIKRHRSYSTLTINGD